MEVETDGYYFFQVGRSYTTVRFKKGQNVHVSIDASDFFTSIIYSGDLKKENNYNVAKSQLRANLVGDTKEYFVVPLNDFLPKIENLKKHQKHIQIWASSSVCSPRTVDLKLYRKCVLLLFFL